MAFGGSLASWGSRLGAYLIDSVILVLPFLLICVAIGGMVGAPGAESRDATLTFLLLSFAIALLVFFVVSLFYAPLLMAREGARNGQTWGKEMMGIRVVRDNGQPWNFGSAAMREVVVKGLAVSIASSLIPVLPWFLNFLWPLMDDQNRALHDIAVSSHVVRA